MMRNNNILLIFSVSTFCSIPLTSHSIELTASEPEEQQVQKSNLVNIVNTSPSPASISFSNGLSIEIEEDSGKIIPCSDLEGLEIFLHDNSGIASSTSVVCGFTYTIKE